jgi:hypothetical protein
MVHGQPLTFVKYKTYIGLEKFELDWKGKDNAFLRRSLDSLGRGSSLTNGTPGRDRERIAPTSRLDRTRVRPGWRKRVEQKLHG